MDLISHQDYLVINGSHPEDFGHYLQDDNDNGENGHGHCDALQIRARNDQLVLEKWM